MTKQICFNPFLPAFFLVILFALGAIIAPFTSKILFLNLTPSAPIGLYIKDQTALKQGDYLILDLPEKIKKALGDRPWYNGKYLLKKVGAVEGEIFEIRQKQFFIHDEKIGQVYTKDGQGLPLPQLEEGQYSVQPEYILPVSAYARSFDGRYYGAVNTKCIITKVRPLLIKGGK